MLAGMLAYLLLGVTFAFAAAVQPGPLQAYIVSRTLSHGWRRALPAAFSPLLSDGPIIVLALLALSRLPAGFERGLRLAGGGVPALPGVARGADLVDVDAGARVRRRLRPREPASARPW